MTVFIYSIISKNGLFFLFVFCSFSYDYHRILSRLRMCKRRYFFFVIFFCYLSHIMILVLLACGQVHFVLCVSRLSKFLLTSSFLSVCNYMMCALCILICLISYLQPNVETITKNSLCVLLFGTFRTMSYNHFGKSFHGISVMTGRIQ